MIRVFGISNCDKCREAKKWLEKQEIDFEFIIRHFELEERIYKFRCVEAWSMIVPWYGFSLSEFIDFRKQALAITDIQRWIESIGQNDLLNRRGTTWRALPDEVKENFEKLDVVNIILEKPTLIKRPVFETREGLLLGFSSGVMKELMSL